MTDLLIARALRVDADEISREWRKRCAGDPGRFPQASLPSGTDLIVSLARVLDEGIPARGLDRRATEAVESFARRAGSAQVAARQLQCLRTLLRERIAYLAEGGPPPEAEEAVRLVINLAIATAQRYLADGPELDTDQDLSGGQRVLVPRTTEPAQDDTGYHPEGMPASRETGIDHRSAPSTRRADDAPLDLSEIVREVGSERGPIRRRHLLVFLDFLTVLLASFAAMALTRQGVPTNLPKVASVVAYAVACIALIALQRLYQARVSAIRAVEISRLARVVVLAGLSGLAFDRVLDPFTPSIEVFLRAFVVFLALASTRGAFQAWLHRRRKQDPGFTRPVIIVGTNEEAMDLHSLVQQHPEFGYRVEGFVGPANPTLRDLGLPWLGDFREVIGALERKNATGAIVASSGIPLTNLNQVVRRLLKEGVHVHLSSGLRGIHHRRVISHPLAYEPLLYLEQVSFSRWQRGMKRALDLVIGTIALLVSLPVIALAALAIKLQDGGPVIFRQERVGHGGKRFVMLKFRTMETDAEQRLAEIQSLNQRHGPLFKVKDDPRVTKVGQLLRDMDIDELPQLINVLQGSMSLVGPRPALPHEVESFKGTELDDYRQQVRPGMTGMWQDRARDDPSFGAYERWDSFYVENWSVMLDLAVMFSTAQKVAGRSISALFHLVMRSRTRSPHRWSP